MPKKPKAKPVEEDWEFDIGWHELGYIPSEFQKRMYCARNNAGSVPQWEHFKWLALKVAPGYAWHYWSDIRFKGLCEHSFTIWMAGGGVGKTSDAALFALVYWLLAPHETYIAVASTTKDMLRGRIWGQLSRFFQRMPDEVRREFLPPGTGDLLDSQCQIRFTPGDPINIIKGVAVQDGPAEEAVNNIIGQHTTRVFVLLDEMQGVRKAIMDAIPNLLKNPESKFHGMGNPQSLNTLLCEYAEPFGGWESIPKFTPEWDIDAQGYPGVGKAFFFDGRKSPSVLDPEWGARNTWMTSAKQIADHLNSKKVGGNENHPDFMWQTIGWPPDKGLEQTVLDMATVHTFLLKQNPVWTSHTVTFMAVDPAYDGGDDAILQIMRRGDVKDEQGERTIVAGVEQLIIPIDAEDELPVDYQIANYVKEQGKRRNIPPRECAIACAGRGAAIKSILDVEWGTVNGIEEGGSPSERVVDERGRTAKESYNTRSSELCFALRDFARGNQLRAVPAEVIEQACARLTFDHNGKSCVEPKTATKGLIAAKGSGAKGFKQRLGYSPDEMDAWNIGLEHARQMGVELIWGTSTPKRPEEWNREVVQTSTEYSDENYLERTDWEAEPFMNVY